MSEKHLSTAIATSTAAMGEDDTAILVTGRNKLVGKAMQDELRSFKPKLYFLQLYMEPDEEDMLKKLKASKSRAGSIDLRETHYEVRKHRRPAKGNARRFVPGNTAFRTMRPIPLLDLGSMTKISRREKDRVFRGVQRDDKFAGRKGGDGDANSEPEKTEEDGEGEEGSEGEAAPADDGDMVIFFHSELHPHVCAQFLWEYDAAVLVDYSPGAGMMLKTALVMGMKCLFVALNKDVGRIATRHYLLPNTT